MSAEPPLPKPTLSIEDSLLTALVSGVATAAVTGTLTYPFDFIKTQNQLNNWKAMDKFKIPSNSPTSLAQLFKGCSALVIGNAVKSSFRIFLYHWLSSFMAIDAVDAHGNHVGRTTAPRLVIAGAMSGFFETLCLIPFENIKIHMIQNQLLLNEKTRLANSGSNIDVTGFVLDKHHKPAQNLFLKQYVSPHAYFTTDVLAQYKGKSSTRFSSTHIVKHSKVDALKRLYNKNPSLTFWGTVKEIYSIKGINGFAYGGLITVVRQTMISTIWLSSYNWTKQVLLPHHKGGEGWFSDQYTLIQSVGLQLAAAGAVIATTQPIDIVKSHMQLKNSHSAYKDSLRTAYKLVMQNGVFTLYRGWFPRGVKVAVSGGFSATFYAYFERMINTASTKTVFSNE
jgi:hypothetical protein